jgi:hypothetical protein
VASCGYGWRLDAGGGNGCPAEAGAGIGAHFVPSHHHFLSGETCPDEGGFELTAGDYQRLSPRNGDARVSTPRQRVDRPCGRRHPHGNVSLSYGKGGTEAAADDRMSPAGRRCRLLLDGFTQPWPTRLFNRWPADEQLHGDRDSRHRHGCQVRNATGARESSESQRHPPEFRLS